MGVVVVRKRYELLSDNLILIIKEIMKNEKLCKLIDNNNNTPLSNINPTTNLLNVKIFPYSFDPEAVIEKQTQLRVFYPSGRIKNRVIEDTDICFDIVIHKDLHLIGIDNRSCLRELEIMSELLNTFEDKSISTLGIIKFTNFVSLNINREFDCFRVLGKIMTIGG